MTLVGAAIAAYQFIRDRQRALDSAWYEERSRDLTDLARAVDIELRRRGVTR
jgi:hypothetical protein